MNLSIGDIIGGGNYALLGTSFKESKVYAVANVPSEDGEVVRNYRRTSYKEHEDVLYSKEHTFCVECEEEAFSFTENFPYVEMFSRIDEGCSEEVNRYDQI